MLENRQRKIPTGSKEVLGKRKVNRIKREYKTPWYDGSVKNLGNEKKNAFLAYKRLKPPEGRDKYLKMRNRVNQEID